MSKELQITRIESVETFKREQKELHALEIIFSHKLLNYILKNEKCRNMYHLSQEDYELLKEVHSWFMSQ